MAISEVNVQAEAGDPDRATVAVVSGAVDVGELDGSVCEIVPVAVLMAFCQKSVWKRNVETAMGPRAWL